MLRRFATLLALLAAIAVAAMAAASASAAPITCPGGQTAQQTSPGTWQCVNNGDNASGAGRHKGTDARI
jgi:ABC-type sugar transport system substrate-binding protein